MPGGGQRETAIPETAIQDTAIPVIYDWSTGWGCTTYHSPLPAQEPLSISLIIGRLRRILYPTILLYRPTINQEPWGRGGGKKRKKLCRTTIKSIEQHSKDQLIKGPANVEWPTFSRACYPVHQGNGKRQNLQIVCHDATCHKTRPNHKNYSTVQVNLSEQETFCDEMLCRNIS
jgi:hypothetical protein